MIEILSRRLRIRDDGTGKGREIEGTLSEFESETAIILLGDPGMGKTSLFKAAAKKNYTTVRNFLIDPHVIAGEPLFLDAFDEYRSIASGQDASSEIAKTLCSLKKPKFRLSCRAADWFGSTDQEVLRVASASGRIIVLELCPMSRDEILNAVQEIIRNPDVFLQEAASMGLGNLLGNPQTLKLLASAWETDKKPRNKFGAFDIGISELIREVNPAHVERGTNMSATGDLRKAASAAASTILLSNSVGISRTETADDVGYVGLQIVPYPNRRDLDAVLKRRLFISTGADLFEPAHRTFVEFLAAEDLSNRIANGLPIDRVLAIICGVDGKPISSLRGVFAWLMCKLGHVAESYVGRDPYGVVTYGDASVLSPSAQCAIWAGLRQLRDPWFLTREEDHGAFNGLANANTAKILKEILKDPLTEIHLKIAVLEAIANSTEDVGMVTILRDMVLEKHHKPWLRSNGLKALYKSIQNDPVKLENIDRELAQADDDIAAPEIRVDLLRLTNRPEELARRILSILEQASNTEREEHTIGRFYPLIDLPSDSELDKILESPSWTLILKNRTLRFEFQSLFEQWLKRRLDSSAPITPLQLSGWLRKMLVSREYHSEETLTSMKARFKQELTLFENVFELLAQDPPNDERSFWLFIAHDLIKILPMKVWLIPQSSFFLSRAKKELNPEQAADLFRMYLSWLPAEGTSVAQTEAGFEFLGQRHDVVKVLGNWNSCEIPKWRRDNLEYQEEERRRRLENRAQNIAEFSPLLTSIRKGQEERILAWAAVVYHGLFNDLTEFHEAGKRLLSVTNEEVADAFVQGFMRYIENPNIPKRKEIIESWLENKYPYTNILLTVSVFLRQKAGMIVPAKALPSCIAAVIKAFPAGEKIPGYDETLREWVVGQVQQNPNIVKSVLKEMWVSGITNNNEELPGFSALSRDARSQQFLVSLSVDVLKTGISEAHKTVERLVSILLLHDQQVATGIGEAELARNELSQEVRAIWSTALFVINPNKYLISWRTLMSEKNAALWNAIEIIRGDRYEKRTALSLTSGQRAEIVTVMGRRFPLVAQPSGGWGSRNPWEASEFIANQIRLLAADRSTDAGCQLERLENDDGLKSYHDLIRHHRAQYEKQQRDSSFQFASPEKVAEAISNRAPATPSDLLAFIIDHLEALSQELTKTQREMYRAYWNENGKKLIKPKHEEVCSGLLAEDLQRRIHAHNLIATVEHHMVEDKECDLVILQGIDRLLPIEVKHHFHAELWTAWRTQLDRLYTRDAMAGGLGIYLVLWSGEDKDRKMPKIPNSIKRPDGVTGLCRALESLIPIEDQHRLRVVVVDISKP